jgi:putative transposase
VIETIRQGLKEDGLVFPLSKLCKWLEVPRRTAYYKPTKATPKVKPELAAPIKAMIEESPSFGYALWATC